MLGFLWTERCRSNHVGLVVVHGPDRDRTSAARTFLLLRRRSPVFSLLASRTPRTPRTWRTGCGHQGPYFLLLIAVAAKKRALWNPPPPERPSAAHRKLRSHLSRVIKGQHNNFLELADRFGICSWTWTHGAAGSFCATGNVVLPQVVLRFAAVGDRNGKPTCPLLHACCQRGIGLISPDVQREPLSTVASVAEYPGYALLP